MRNIKKTAEKGKAIVEKRSGLDLTYGELEQFFDNFQKSAETTGITNALWETINDAYKTGLVVGLRNA